LNKRVLIIDDEPLARRGVAIRLAEYPNMSVVGEGASGEEALSLIPRLKPDLIFLDIQMADMNGIDVLRSLPPRTVPAVIFLTAFDEYAVAAFEVQALDYLLKPLDDERFACAIERANRLLDLEQQEHFQARLSGLLQLHDEQGRVPAKRFAVRKGNHVSFVQATDIDWVGASGDYAGLHVGGKVHLIHQTLNVLEGKLDPKEFIRIHRSTIVQLDRIARIDALANRDCELTLRNGTMLRVSRTYSHGLWAMLRSLGF